MDDARAMIRIQNNMPSIHYKYICILFRVFFYNGAVQEHDYFAFGNFDMISVSVTTKKSMTPRQRDRQADWQTASA